MALTSTEWHRKHINCSKLEVLRKKNSYFAFRLRSLSLGSAGLQQEGHHFKWHFRFALNSSHWQPSESSTIAELLWPVALKGAFSIRPKSAEYHSELDKRLDLQVHQYGPSAKSVELAAYWPPNVHSVEGEFRLDQSAIGASAFKREKTPNERNFSHRSQWKRTSKSTRQNDRPLKSFNSVGLSFSLARWMPGS